MVEPIHDELEGKGTVFSRYRQRLKKAGKCHRCGNFPINCHCKAYYKARYEVTKAKKLENKKLEKGVE